MPFSNTSSALRYLPLRFTTTLAAAVSPKIHDFLLQIQFKTGRLALDSSCPLGTVVLLGCPTGILVSHHIGGHLQPQQALLYRLRTFQTYPVPNYSQFSKAGTDFPKNIYL